MIPTDAPLVDYTEQCIEAALEIAGDPKHEIGPRRLGLAWDIAAGAFVEPPLFGDDDRHETIRFLVAVAWRESSVRQDAIGKGGECTMFQLKPAFLGLTCAELVKDAQAATRAALRVMRISRSVCGDGRAWFNAFAGGDRACGSSGAQAITDNRTELANEIGRRVGP